MSKPDVRAPFGDFWHDVDTSFVDTATSFGEELPASTSGNHLTADSAAAELTQLCREYVLMDRSGMQELKTAGELNSGPDYEMSDMKLKRRRTWFAIRGAFDDHRALIWSNEGAELKLQFEALKWFSAAQHMRIRKPKEYEIMESAVFEEASLEPEARALVGQLDSEFFAGESTDQLLFCMHLSRKYKLDAKSVLDGAAKTSFNARQAISLVHAADGNPAAVDIVSDALSKATEDIETLSDDNVEVLLDAILLALRQFGSTSVPQSCITATVRRTRQLLHGPSATSSDDNPQVPLVDWQEVYDSSKVTDVMHLHKQYSKGDEHLKANKLDAERSARILGALSELNELRVSVPVAHLSGEMLVHSLTQLRRQQGALSKHAMMKLFASVLHTTSEKEIRMFVEHVDVHLGTYIDALDTDELNVVLGVLSKSPVVSRNTSRIEMAILRRTAAEDPNLDAAATLHFVAACGIRNSIITTAACEAVSRSKDAKAIANCAASLLDAGLKEGVRLAEESVDTLQNVTAISDRTATTITAALPATATSSKWKNCAATYISKQLSNELITTQELVQVVSCYAALRGEKAIKKISHLPTAVRSHLARKPQPELILMLAETLQRVGKEIGSDTEDAIVGYLEESA